MLLNATCYITGVINPVKKRDLKKKRSKRRFAPSSIRPLFRKKLTVFPYATKI